MFLEQRATERGAATIDKVGIDRGVVPREPDLACARADNRCPDGRAAAGPMAVLGFGKGAKRAGQDHDPSSGVSSLRMV